MSHRTFLLLNKSGGEPKEEEGTPVGILDTWMHANEKTN